MDEAKPSASGITPKKVVGALILIAWVAFVLSYIIPMISRGEAETVVTIMPEYVDIGSDRGVRIPIGSISSIELKDDMPPILRRVSGYNSVTVVKKGHYEIEGMGVGRIYIFTKNGPFLFIHTESEFVVIAFEDPEKTRRLHEEMAETVE